MAGIMIDVCRRFVGLLSLPLGLLYESIKRYPFATNLVGTLLLWHFSSLYFLVAYVLHSAMLLLAYGLSALIQPRLVHFRWRLLSWQLQVQTSRGSKPTTRVIAYLRPFDADPSVAMWPPYEGAAEEDLLGYDVDGYAVISGEYSIQPIHIEALLRVALSPWGYLVGLANPAESRQRVSRFHVLTDHNWRRSFHTMCRYSELIVAVVPATRLSGAASIRPWVPPEAQMAPRLSYDAAYASFFSELQYVVANGYSRKLLIVVPEWRITSEKWRVIQARLAHIGLTVSNNTWMEGGQSELPALGLFMFDRGGQVARYKWWRAFPLQHQWDLTIWRRFVNSFSILQNRRVPRFRFVIALSEHQWLLGPGPGDIIRWIERADTPAG